MPVSFRVPFESQISKLPPEHQVVVRTQWNAITDLQGAIPALKTQIEALKPSTSTTSSTGTTNTTQNVTSITNNYSGGVVNNQSGNTVYTTTQNDNGALVILSDTVSVAVTLNNSVKTPYWVFFLNQGTGLVTVTPQQGTINGEASEKLTNDIFALVFFDGSNWFSCTTSIVPQTFAVVAQQFLTSYSALTGIFTAAQPSFTDISGTAAVTQGGTGATTAPVARTNLGAAASGANADITSLTGLTTPLPIAEGGTGTSIPSLISGANISITGSFPGQTVATTGYSGTITTAKLTTGGTNGSMTFTAGALVSQVAAT